MATATWMTTGGITVVAITHADARYDTGRPFVPATLCPPSSGCTIMIIVTINYKPSRLGTPLYPCSVLSLCQQGTVLVGHALPCTSPFAESPPTLPGKGGSCGPHPRRITIVQSPVRRLRLLRPRPCKATLLGSHPFRTDRRTDRRTKSFTVACIHPRGAASIHFTCYPEQRPQAAMPHNHVNDTSIQNCSSTLPHLVYSAPVHTHVEEVCQLIRELPRILHIKKICSRPPHLG